MAVGSTISFNDLSTLRDTMNTILNGSAVGSGYNQGHAIAANPATGDLIDDAYYDSLYSAAAKIANFYNITNPFTAVDAGTVVAWSHYGSNAASFNSTLTTQHAAPWTYAVDWDTSVSSVLSSSVSNWNAAHTFDFNLTFSSTAHMNSWFTAGGDIRISASHNSSADAQAASWQQLCTELGTFVISVQPTDSTNVDLATVKKYSELGTSYATIKQEYANDTYYSMNTIQVQAYKSATVVYVRVIIDDAHVGGTFGTQTGSDIVSGTTTVSVSSRTTSNATGSVVIAAPTYNVTSNL